ncbi:LexA family transcriptional regulator [Methylorubrum extorquens]|uniref:LexA family transcriptional regulator n=1 Tax=Methylorubrum extorquens TaxID=408 RepID=UPI002238AF90|nr:LexA family transcriptional regulator [Methylorubrum extorquens]UYW32482.1 LexA family transcriptional regulator [Methylorubrum extorquens]
MSALRHFRTKAGLSQQALATAAGTSQPQIKRLEAGERTLSKKWAEQLAPHLGITAETLLFPPEPLEDDADDVNAPRATDTAVPERGHAAEANVVVPEASSPVDTSTFKGPRNVPVYGTGSGGDGGDFSFNGQLIDHAPRPPGIANRKDVYVVYLVGDSISPAYEDGTPIYVDPHRRPQPRDYVVVELRGAREDEPGPAFVKRLVARGAGKLKLEQHNPSGPLDPIDESEVVRVHRVIPWLELIGV